MCIYSKLSINPRKVYSPFHREQYLINYHCGHCSECQTQLSNEWYFRSIYEYRACVNSGGYMLFDCLTYADNTLPRLSNYIDYLPNNLNFMCFSHEDTTNFLKRLRVYLERKGYAVKDNLRYFLATEYGTTEGCTHRPHVHILFYIFNNFIDPEFLSLAISENWKLGRTDGIQYKGHRYLYDRCVIKSGLASSTRVCKYVSKYVQKDCSFQKTLNKRITACLWHYFNNTIRYTPTEFEHYSSGAIVASKIDAQVDYDSFNEFCESERGKKIARDLKRQINQYHRQSCGYGLSAINNIDLSDLVKHNTLTCPDGNRVVMRIALPSYYKRKLFYEITTFKGAKTWQLTSIGRKYVNQREKYILENLVKKLECEKRQFNLQFDASALAHYQMFERGRLLGNILSSPTIDEKKLLPDLIYNYSHASDKKQFKMRGVTHCWHGYSDHYNSSSLRDAISTKTFIQQYVYLNPYYESIIDKLDSLRSRFLSKKKQQVFELKQKLSSLYKILYPSTI